MFGAEHYREVCDRFAVGETLAEDEVRVFVDSIHEIRVPVGRDQNVVRKADQSNCTKKSKTQNDLLDDACSECGRNNCGGRCGGNHRLQTYLSKTTCHSPSQDLAVKRLCAEFWLAFKDPNG